MPAFDIDTLPRRARAPWTLRPSTGPRSRRIPCRPRRSAPCATCRTSRATRSSTCASLLATRAIDDPDVATFLACWVHEETFHGLALAALPGGRRPSGGRRAPTPRGQEPLRQAARGARRPRWCRRLWPDFCAVHMTWGAINELTTLTGYRRLAALRRITRCSPELLERIVRDESRHFFFYYRQAELRLRRPGGRAGRPLPGGPLLGARWAAASSPRPSCASWPRYLFGGDGGPRRGPQGRRDDPPAARASTTVQLLEAWMDRHVEPAPAPTEDGMATRSD